MRIEHLSLVNWGRFEEVEIPFSGNFIGLIGGNGRGKSTIVRAIRYLMTGTTERQKERNLRFGADSGHAEMRFAADDHQYIIHRDIATAKCWLQVDDGKKIRKGVEVNEVIDSVRRVSAKMFSSHIVIRQGELDRILRARPAERAAEFGSLCGTEQCEKLREILQNRINSYPTVVLNVSPTELQTELTAIEGRLREWSGTLQRILQELGKLDLPGAERTTGRYDQAGSTRKQMGELDEVFGRLTKELATENQRLAVLTGRDVTGTLEQLRESYDTARRQLESHRANSNLLQQRKRVQDRLGTMQRERESLRTPAAPAESEEVLAAARAEQTTLSSQAEQARRVIAVCASGDKVCPTCGQSLVEVSRLAAHYQQRVQQLGPTLAQLSQRVRGIEAGLQQWTSDCAVCTSRATSLGHSIVGATEELNSFPATLELLDDEEVRAVVDLVGQYEDLERAARDTRIQLDAAQRTVATLDARIGALREQRERMVIEHVSEEEYQQAVVVRASHRELTTKRVEAETILRTKTTELEDRRKQLQELTEKAERVQQVADYRGLLDRTRSVLHRDNLPRLVAHAYLDRVNAGLNRILGQFQFFPYTVELQDDLSFVYTSPTGHTAFADDLSGGEGIIFSLAFRLAIQEQFASHLQLLILDEPTVYVDTDNTRVIADVLMDARQYVRGAGMQLIIVTHKRELERAMDQVVNVNDL